MNLTNENKRNHGLRKCFDFSNQSATPSGLRMSLLARTYRSTWDNKTMSQCHAGEIGGEGEVLIWKTEKNCQKFEITRLYFLRLRIKKGLISQQIENGS